MLVYSFIHGGLRSWEINTHIQSESVSVGGGGAMVLPYILTFGVTIGGLLLTLICFSTAKLLAIIMLGAVVTL
jgi:hypothetical protein